MALITGLATPEQQAFVLHRLASNLGIAVGPALGGFLAHYSYTSIFGSMASRPSSAWSCFWPGCPTLRWIPMQGPPSGSGCWRDWRLLGLLLWVTRPSLVFTQIHGTLPLWISRDLHHGTRMFGLVFTFNTILILLLEVAINTRMAFWTHGHQLALGALLIASASASLLAGPLPLLALSVIVWSLGEMILLPASTDAAAALAPADRRGEYMGSLSLRPGPWPSPWAPGWDCLPTQGWDRVSCGVDVLPWPC